MGIRVPRPGLSRMSFADLRPLVLEGVGRGYVKESPFLRTCPTAVKAHQIAQEASRQQWYSGTLVRFDLSGYQPEEVLDLSSVALQQRFFRECDDDSDATITLLRDLRGYSL